MKNTAIRFLSAGAAIITLAAVLVVAGGAPSRQNAHAATTSLRFVFGEIQSDGSVTAGMTSIDPVTNMPDFTAKRIGTGVYQITFAPGVFSEEPSIAVTPILNDDSDSVTWDASTQSWDVQFASGLLSDPYANGGPSIVAANTAFNFVAVGASASPNSNVAVITGKGTTSGGGATLSFGLSPFSRVPVVVANNNAHTDCIAVSASPTSPSAYSVSFHTWGSKGGGNSIGCISVNTNDQFSYIAIGQSDSPNLDTLAVVEGGSAGAWGTKNYSVYSASGGYQIGFPGNLFSSVPAVVGNVQYTGGTFCLGYQGATINGVSAYESGSASYACNNYSMGLGVQPVTMIAIGPAVTYDGAPVPNSDNIPSTFASAETKTVGSDGNPLAIVMKNTGTATWVSYPKTMISQSGTCPLPSPSTSTANDACIQTWDYSSNQIFLNHVSSAFGVSPPSVSYTNIVTSTQYIKPQMCGSGYGAYQCGWQSGTFNSGPTDIEPGATTTFYLTSMKAPSAAGPYTETWNLYNASTSKTFGTPFTKSITVGAPTAGTLSVTSVDSQDANVSVSSTWQDGGLVNLTDSSSEPCAMGIPCSGTQQVYPAVPVNDLYGLNAVDGVTVAPYNPALWVLHSVEAAPIASAAPVRPLFSLSFLSDFIRTADAAVACSYPGVLGSSPCSLAQGTYSATQLLTATGPTNEANFIIFWDPVAQIGLNPASFALNVPASSTISTTTILVNTGAVGSVLNWTASTAAWWLRVNPSSGSLAAGSSTWVSLTALTSDGMGNVLGPGTQTSTAVMFTGTSAPSNAEHEKPQAQTLNVTLSVGTTTSIVPTGPDCSDFTADPPRITPPGNSTLSWSCTNANSCTLSGGQFGNGTSTGTSGNVPVSPTTNTTYTLSCSGSGSTNTFTAETTVTTQGPNVHETNP